VHDGGAADDVYDWICDADWRKALNEHRHGVFLVTTRCR